MTLILLLVGYIFCKKLCRLKVTYCTTICKIKTFNKQIMCFYQFMYYFPNNQIFITDWSESLISFDISTVTDYSATQQHTNNEIILQDGP